MLKKNYHTHLELCGHAQGMSEDYVKMAIGLNMKSLGISDHAPILDNIMTNQEYEYNYCFQNMTYDEFINVYIPDVLNAKKKYPQINVHLGIETEYIKEYHSYYENMSKKLDYMILGQHFFLYNKRIVCTYDKMTDEEILAYAKTIEEGLDSKLFKYLAHPDLFLYSQDGFNETCHKASEIIIEAAIRNDVVLEVNVGGVRRGLINGHYRYPRQEFFNLAKKAKIIVGIDAHYVVELDDDNLEKTLLLVKEWGINIIDELEI